MLTIYGTLYSKKNSKQIVTRGRFPALISSKAYLQNVAPMQAQLMAAENKAIWEEMIKGKPLPYKIHFTIYRKTERKSDYVNIVQGLLDEMQSSGYIADDDYAHVIPFFAETALCRDNPRVEIRLIKSVDYEFCD